MDTLKNDYRPLYHLVSNILGLATNEPVEYSEP